MVELRAEARPGALGRDRAGILEVIDVSQPGEQLRCETKDLQLRQLCLGRTCGAHRHAIEGWRIGVPQADSLIAAVGGGS